MLCQRQGRRYSAAKIGQRICCLIHEQVGRDSVPQTEQHCKGPVAVVHLEVDMFALRLITQLDRFFSWKALDAFSQDWTNL